MSFFRRIWRSVTEIRSYREILYQRAGRSLGYLALLVALIFAFQAGREAVGFAGFYRQLEAELRAGIPEFRLSGGILHFEGPQPYVLESQQATIIVDTTGSIDPEQLDPDWRGIFFGEKEVWFKQEGRADVLPYRELGLEFSKGTVIGWLPYLKPLAVFVAVIGYGFVLAGKVLSTAFAASLVSLLARARRQSLPFFAAWNLAAHAVTLPLLLSFLGGLLDVRLPLLARLLFYYGLTLVYAHLVLQPGPVEEPPEPPHSPVTL